MDSEKVIKRDNEYVLHTYNRTQGRQINCNFKVEPQTFTADLTTRLRSL